jgi:hypothetical protein
VKGQCSVCAREVDVIRSRDMKGGWDDQCASCGNAVTGVVQEQEGAPSLNISSGSTLLQSGSTAIHIDQAGLWVMKHQPQGVLDIAKNRLESVRKEIEKLRALEREEKVLAAMIVAAESVCDA